MARVELCKVVKIATLAAILWQPVTHFDNTRRVLAALTGGTVECINGSSPETPTYQFDAIAIFGAGAAVQNPDGTFEPNPIQKSRIEAAAILYAKHTIAKTIVILDGKLPEKEPQNVSRDYFKKVYTQITGDKQKIPDTAFIVENKSINTATNALELSNIADEFGMQKILVITHESHRNRATNFVCSYGIAANSQSVEQIFTDNLSESEQFGPVQGMQNTLIKERLELVGQIFDPTGILPTALKQQSLPFSE